MRSLTFRMCSLALLLIAFSANTLAANVLMAFGEKIPPPAFRKATAVLNWKCLAKRWPFAAIA